MSSTEIAFKVVDENNCPYYNADDEIKLSGNALSLEFDKEQTFISTAIVRFPNDRSACRILISDLTNALFQYKNIDKIPAVEMECSGCSGLIRMQTGVNNCFSANRTSDSPSERIDPDRKGPLHGGPDPGPHRLSPPAPSRPQTAV